MILSNNSYSIFHLFSLVVGCQPTVEEILAIHGTGVKTVQTGRLRGLTRCLSVNPLPAYYAVNVKKKSRTDLHLRIIFISHSLARARAQHSPP